jgi:hypothetical protein
MPFAKDSLTLALSGRDQSCISSTEVTEKSAAAYSIAGDSSQGKAGIGGSIPSAGHRLFSLT